MKHLLLPLFALLFIGCNSESSPAARNGKLYLRTHMWTGAYGSSLDISWIFLGDDGMLIKNPVHGVNPVDWGKEKIDNSSKTGTYKMEGDKLMVNWSNGSDSEWSVEKEGGEIVAIDGGIVSEAASLPADYKLEGTYEGSAVLPNVANMQTFVFSNDGSFILSSMGAISTSDVNASAEEESKGTYQVNGNTLTLKFGNGEVRKSVIAVMEMDDKENLIINTRYYPLRK